MISEDWKHWYWSRSGIRIWCIKL